MLITTLLRASIDGALLVAVVWLVTRVVRLSPATRTLLWWCAAAKFVVALAWPMPITLAILPATESPAIIARANPPSESGAAPADVFSRVATRVGPRLSSRLADRFVPDPALTDAIAQPFRGLREWGSVAVMGWLLGLLLLAYVAIRRWRQTAAIVRASVDAGPELQQQAATLSARLGLRRVPEVRVSPDIDTPLVTRFMQPVVMFPADRLGALTDRETEMALCHELLHVKRADLWFGCVPALAERLFFFHPLVQFASREYALAREAACDAAVVETLDAAPREYGHLLLALGVSRPQTGAAAGAAQSFQHFKRRIAMLQDLPPRTDRSRFIAATVVGLALVAIIPLRLGARPSPAPRLTRTVAHAQSDSVVAAPIERERVESARARRVSQEPQIEDDGHLRFVLLREDNQTTSSGSRDDERRARRYQRNGEPLLWFYRDGHEYVVRDPEVIRQVSDAWRRVSESDLDHDMSAVAQQVADSVLASGIGDIGALVGEHAGKIGALVGEQAGDIAANAAALAGPAAEFGVQMAGIGLEAAAEALSAVGPALSQIGDLNRLDIHVDTEEFRRHQREIAREIRDLQDDIRRDVERSLKNDFKLQKEQMRDLEDSIRELQRSLSDMNLKDLKEPLKDLKEPMKDFSRQMESLGRTIGEYAREAADETRDIINRAISSGKAQRVK
jgi:bla regulator protein blaR1